MSSVRFEITKPVILQSPNSSTRMLSAFRFLNRCYVRVRAGINKENNMLDE